MLSLGVEASRCERLGMEESEAIFRGDLRQPHLPRSRGRQVFKEFISCAVEGQLVSGLDSLLECKPLDSLLEGHLCGRVLSPAVMKRLVDSKLELLGDDQPTLKGLFVGVKVYAKLLAVGDAVALAFYVEDDGVTVVPVLGQTRRNELHELTVLLPYFLHTSP